MPRDSGISLEEGEGIENVTTTITTSESRRGEHVFNSCTKTTNHLARKILGFGTINKPAKLDRKNPCGSSTGIVSRRDDSCLFFFHGKERDIHAPLAAARPFFSP